MIYLAWAARYGKKSTSNPWPATGLEWRTASPPVPENFEETPTVTWEAYEFRPREEMEVVGLIGEESPKHS
jgi:cytochrome c oxidase subunit 1